MKNKLFALALLSSFCGNAQIGINTATPSATFDIVSKGSTDATKAVEINSSGGTELITVLDNGNLGINISNPTTKLHLNSTTNPAFRLVDGTQAAGRVLSSDANGNASWQRNFIPRVVGTLGGGFTLPYGTNGTYFQTGSTITLPPGTWAVSVISLLAPSGSLTVNDYMWIRSTFSDSPVTTTRSNDITGTPFLISGGVQGIIPYHIASGTVVINNATAAPKTYYYIVGDTIGSSSNPANVVGSVGGGWGENLISALPIN